MESTQMFINRWMDKWIVVIYTYTQASLVAQLVKNPPAMWETWVWSLGWEDPLEKGKTTHSNILAQRTPWTFSPWGCKESDMTDRLSLHFTHIDTQRNIIQP